MKRYIKILTLMLLFFSIPQLITAMSFGSSVYSGSGEALTIPTNITSWHPASGPYGIRVTLVNTNNGRRVSGSISIDYSDFEGLEGFGYFSNTKKSKLDYISSNTQILNITNLTIPSSITNQYRYTLLSNTTLPKLLTANKANVNTIIREYFRSEYSPVKQKSRFITLLTELNAGTPFINAVNNVTNGNYTNVFNTYNYALVIEPILYFALRSDNFYGSKVQYATYIAASATEAALLLNNVNNAGNIKNISHITLPRSLYVDSTIFAGSDLQLTAIGAGQATSNTLLNSNDIYTKTGYGLSVLKLSDLVTSASPTNTYSPSYLSTNPYAMSVVENGSSILTSQTNAYRTVSCNESMNANYPSASFKLKAGTHFVFEPLEMTGIKTCNATIDVNRLVNDYNSKATEVKNAYDAYIKAKARYDTWVAKKNRTVVGECNVKYNVSKTTTPGTLTITGFPNVSGGFEVYNSTKGIPSTAYRHVFQYTITSQYWFAGSNYSVNNQTYALVDYRTQYGRTGAGPTVMVMGIPPSSYFVSNPAPLEYVKADIMLPYLKIAYRDRGGPMQYKLLLKYVLPKTTCAGTVSYDYGVVDGRNKTICTDYSVWPFIKDTKFFDGADECVINTGNACTIEKYTYTRTSNKSYNWWYGYTTADGTYNTVRPNNGEVTNTCETSTMPSYTGLYNTYISLRDQLSSLETILRSIGGWTTDSSTEFANDAELSVKTTDASGTNLYTAFDISKTTNQSVTNTTFGGNVATYNDVGVRDGGSISISNIPTSLTTTVNKKYNLASNTNRYILKDTGAVVSSLPSKYTSGGTLAGYYSDIGYPNYKVGVNAIGNGTITISYRNLGSTSYKLDKTLADSIPMAGFVNGNYFTYTSNYTVEGGIIDPTTKNINLVYRQIDLANPFPYYANTETTTERQPGFNWRINTSSVSDVITGPGTNVYNKEPMYVIDFTGSNKSYIQTIRKYNNTNNYQYEMKCNGADAYGNNNGTECRSTYLSTLKSAGVVSGCGTDVAWDSCK